MTDFIKELTNWTKDPSSSKQTHKFFLDVIGHIYDLKSEIERMKHPTERMWAREKELHSALKSVIADANAYFDRIEHDKCPWTSVENARKLL